MVIVGVPANKMEVGGRVSKMGIPSPIVPLEFQNVNSLKGVAEKLQIHKLKVPYGSRLVKLTCKKQTNDTVNQSEGWFESAAARHCPVRSAAAIHRHFWRVSAEIRYIDHPPVPLK
nr:hypothetical protein Iba_chr14dCG14160 [Ipomoea batatas]